MQAIWELKDGPKQNILQNGDKFSPFHEMGKGNNESAKKKESYCFFALSLFSISISWNGENLSRFREIKIFHLDFAKSRNLPLWV